MSSGGYVGGVIAGGGGMVPGGMVRRPLSTCTSTYMYMFMYMYINIGKDFIAMPRCSQILQAL